MGVEDKLRDALIASGKPPKQIGAEAGVDFGAIYKFLKGTAELRCGTFGKLCDWAGLDLAPKGETMAAEVPPSVQDQILKAVEAALKHSLSERYVDLTLWELGYFRK
jgi:hypothetical protein